MGAVFDFQVSLLFRGEGVWGLVKDQDAAPLGRRTFGKVVSALPTYDVEQIFVCQDALNETGLKPAELSIPIRTIDAAAQAELIGNQDLVMGAQS